MKQEKKTNFGYAIPKLNYKADLSNSFNLAHQLYRNFPIHIISSEGPNFVLCTKTYNTNLTVMPSECD